MLKDKLKPKGDAPKEFRDRLWLEIVLLALSCPASITFFAFKIKPVGAMLLFVSLFLIADMARLYYYGYMGHYKILSGPLLDVIPHKRFRKVHTEIIFENEGVIYSTWTNREITGSDECRVCVIVPEKYLFRGKDGIREVNAIFLKVTGLEP